MGATRRPHEKSRRGCLECKRRRIKCNEAKPHCSRCTRYGVSCIYPLAAETQAPQTPSPLPHASRGPAAGSSGLFLDSTTGIEASTTFSMADLALHHHWTLVTSKTIVSTDEVDYIWQRTFPEIGFKHAYVTHGILSLTALHVAYLEPSKSGASVRAATRHHEMSLRGFRDDIQIIGAHNSNAIFANSILLFFYAFLTFGDLYYRDKDPADFTARTNQVLGGEWIPLIRGIQAVLGPLYPHVMRGPLKGLLEVKDWDTIDPDTSSLPSDDHFRRLREAWSDDQHARVYDEALFLLRKCHAFMSQFDGCSDAVERESWGYNRAWSGPFSFLILVSEEYMVLQRQRQPHALIIFAFFGGLLQLLDGYWWMEGCAKSIVQAVDACLGPYWSKWIVWPKQVVGLP